MDVVDTVFTWLYWTVVIGTIGLMIFLICTAEHE